MPSGSVKINIRHCVQLAGRDGSCTHETPTEVRVSEHRQINKKLSKDIVAKRISELGATE